MLVQCTNPNPNHSRKVVIPSPPPLPRFFFVFSYFLSLHIPQQMLPFIIFLYYIVLVGCVPLGRSRVLHYINAYCGPTPRQPNRTH